MEFAIKSIGLENTQVITQGYGGIEVNRLEYHSNAGDLVQVNDTRTEINNSQKALYERKQEKVKKEKHNLELIKHAQATAKLYLESGLK